MPWAIIGQIGLAVGKRAIGSHLFRQHRKRKASDTPTSETVENLVSGYGLRGGIAGLVGLYLSNAEVRHCIDGLVEALKGAL